MFNSFRNSRANLVVNWLILQIVILGKIRDPEHGHKCNVLLEYNEYEFHCKAMTGDNYNWNWTVFMDNGYCKKSNNEYDIMTLEGRKHACGNRYIHDFWPTRLTTQNEREDWWLWLENLIKKLTFI